MNKIERTINEIAQDKIEFDEGCKKVLSDLDFNFEIVFSCLRNYIFNSIPEKTNYNSKVYQDAIQTIPLRVTFTPVVILNSFSTKIAFNKLEKITEAERNKTIIALLWIFKQTDTERRNSVCQNDCGHEWHNIE
jgi:hypothetical protein